MLHPPPASNVDVKNILPKLLVVHQSMIDRASSESPFPNVRMMVIRVSYADALIKGSLGGLNKIRILGTSAHFALDPLPKKHAQN